MSNKTSQSENVDYQKVTTGEQEKRILTSCLQASARLYMFFARQTLADAGEAGEAPVRESVRRYGEWRGTEMREAHIALDKPINVETLMRNWDSASTYVAKDEVQDQGSYAPNDVSFDVTYCPAALAWKEGEFHRWGHVYCDEFHQSAATAYHPDAMVTIPINMMKGDNRCAFRWVMPNQNETDLEPRAEEETTELGKSLTKLYQQTDDELEGMRLALTRTNRLLGGRYATFVQALEQHLDKELVQKIVAGALHKWSEDRGKRLAQWFKQRGINHLEGNRVWSELDLAPDFTWQTTLNDDPNAILSLDISATPLDAVWKTYNTKPWNKVFWDVSMPALFKQLFPENSVNVLTDTDGSLQKLVINK